MKSIKKIAIIFLITVLLVLFMTSNVFAKIDTSKLQNITNPTGVSSLSEMSGKIIGVIYTLAVAVSLGMMFVIGIKYITSSADEKASLKARAIPYFIGAVLVFGAANILRFIEKMAGWIK